MIGTLPFGVSQYATGRRSFENDVKLLREAYAIFAEAHLKASLWADPRRTVLDGKDAFAKIWEELCA